MPTMSSDNNEVDLVSARQFEEISFRMSPARLNRYGDFVRRQEHCHTFRKIALQKVLYVLWIFRQRQWSVIAETLRCLRWPVDVHNVNLALPQRLDFIQPTQRSVAGGGKIVAGER